MARTDTRDWFHVGGETFLDPMMVISDRREREMHHFVGKHPIVSKACHYGFVANMDAN